MFVELSGVRMCGVSRSKDGIDMLPTSVDLSFGQVTFVIYGTESTAIDHKWDGGLQSNIFHFYTFHWIPSSHGNCRVRCRWVEVKAPCS